MAFWTKFFSRQTKPDPYVRHGLMRIRKVEINEENAMKVAAFYRGVTYISTQIAKLPWELKDANNNCIEGPIDDLLDLAPNTEMNSFNFRVLAIQDAIIHGNFFAEIERNTIGTAIALWPLNPRRMTLIRNEDGDLIYRYTNPLGGNVYLEQKNVFHIKNFHTFDGVWGLGLARYASDVLGIQLAADVMASGIFNNGGIPSGTLTHPGKLSDEAYKRLKDSWNDDNTGYKAGGTQLLEEGLKYEPVKSDPEALQFLQSRQFGILEICRFLGIPPQKLFDTTAQTYKNMEQANLEIAQDTLHAWAKNFEMEADIKILNYQFNGRHTEMDLYHVFKGDMDTRSKYYQAMIGIGGISPNEIREKEGMAPLPGTEGDTYFISTNNLTPIDRVNDVIDSQIQPPTPPAPASNQDPNQPDQTKEIDPIQQQLIDVATQFLLGR